MPPANDIQVAVRDLLAIAPQFTDSLSVVQLDAVAEAIDRLQRPISAQDALALLSLLPANAEECYEANWPILHAIESCPDWPIWSSLRVSGHVWIDRLRIGLRNAGLVEPEE